MAWYRCGGTPSEVLSLPTPSEASGAIARFNTDLTENLLSAVAEFSASQASGTPTPSAPIPIQAVNSIAVTRTGKNIFNPSVSLINADNYVINANGTVTVNASDSRAWTSLPKAFIKAGTYAVSRGLLNGRVVIRLETDNYATDKFIINTNAYSGTLTVPEDTYYKIKVGGSGTFPYTDYYQIEVGSTATEYEPYNGTTALINLGGTYYGGSVDAVTGKITLTHKIGQITEADDKYGTWDTEQVMGAFWHASIAQCPWLNDWDNSVRNNGIKVDKYTLQSNVSTNTSTYSMAVYTTKLIRWVDVDRMTMTKEDYNTYLASNPITILYPLATPIVVYASNTAEIPTIVGFNQVYADTGDVAVKYFETVGHKI